MPVNPGIQYQLAEEEFNKADNIIDKLKALQRMYATVPKHKGSEGLQKEIKAKIAKYKKLLAKEKQTKKGSSHLSVKKDGDACICILGKTNVGKSTLLSKLTNAKPLINEYEFTTKMPEIGILDYKGVKLQIIEMPAIVEDYISIERGGFFLGVIRNADLLIFIEGDDYKLIKNELEKSDIKKKFVVYKNDIGKLKENIWKNLSLIKVYTKSKGNKIDNRALALKKGSKVRELTKEIHKDFFKKFKFARVWGKSVKHDGSRVGLDHKLEDDDVVELHEK
ncbi:MAG: TGS domain-containing protein [Nanoarchaeota archaeon]|nr:TGS domain-containing protein [Nanoarchaeota archaeon]